MAQVQLRHPPNLQWEVTTECNHNCIHCYNYWRKDDEKIAGMARVNSEKHYLEMAQKIIEQKPVSVVITGGEPLMVFDRIKSSIIALQDAGIYVSINTNAGLLSERIVQFLIERRIHLFVSFPCANPEVCDEITDTKNSFSNVTSKLDMAHRNNISFTTNVVVSKKNLDYLEETVEFLKKRYDISKVSITRVGKPINSSSKFDENVLHFEDLKRMQEICVRLAKKYGIFIDTGCPYTACSIYTQEAFDMFAYKKLCTAGKTSYAIDTNGNVKACPRDSQLYGNIMTQDFASIWEEMKSWRDGSYMPEECKSCKASAKCMGGCRVDQYPFTGRMDMLDTISNPENLPIKFEKTPKPAKLIEEDERFTLKDTAQFMEENTGVRVSVGPRYMYVTQALYRFISDRKTFSIKEIMGYFDVDLSTANNVVRSLIGSGIIINSEKKGGEDNG